MLFPPTRPILVVRLSPALAAAPAVRSTLVSPTWDGRQGGGPFFLPSFLPLGSGDAPTELLRRCLPRPRLGHRSSGEVIRGLVESHNRGNEPTIQ